MAAPQPITEQAQASKYARTEGWVLTCSDKCAVGLCAVAGGTAPNSYMYD